MDKRLKEIAFGEWEGKSVARNQIGSSGRIPEISTMIRNILQEHRVENPLQK